VNAAEDEHARMALRLARRRMEIADEWYDIADRKAKAFTRNFYIVCAVGGATGVALLVYAFASPGEHVVAAFFGGILTVGGVTYPLIWAANR